MYFRVRIHMFNLYQNQTITKEIIEAKQLDLCRLAFWLCICENGRYIPISSTSYSCIIRESKFHKFCNSFFTLLFLLYRKNYQSIWSITTNEQSDDFSYSIFYEASRIF